MFLHLIYLMKNLKLSQLELAKTLEITPLSLARKIKGENEFKYSEMLKIQKVINKKSDKKYTFEEIFKLEKE